MEKAVLSLLGKGCCRCIYCVALLLLGTEVFAVNQEVSARVRSEVVRHIHTIEQWSQDRRLINAVLKQNAQQTPLVVVQLLDRVWRDPAAAELATTLNKSLAHKVLHRKLLHTHVFKDALLSDQQGVVVGQYPRITDYWRGDEQKFLQALDQGRGRVIVGRPQLNAQLQSYEVQVLVPVYHQQRAVGVLMVTLQPGVETRDL